MAKEGVDLVKTLKFILIAIAILYIIVYLYVVFNRITYPFELEWMEGGSVDHIKRILDGEKLYVKPTLEFVPYIYPPLYFYTSAVLSKIMGVGFLPLRVVSFISSLGCFLMIYLIVKNETKDKFSGILASSLFAATFSISGAWFDIARVDSLFLFFLLAAIYLVRFKESVNSEVLAGILITLSFLTKQTALVIAIALILYCMLTKRGRFFIATTIILIGGSTLILDSMHDEWYVYYIFDLPTKHEMISDILYGFWIEDLLMTLPVAAIMAAVYLLKTKTKPIKEDFKFYLLIAASMIGGSWFSRIHAGGYNNVLIPAYAIISILFGLSIIMLPEYLRKRTKHKKHALKIFVYIACMIQFGLLFYNPGEQIPTQNDLDAGWKLIEKIGEIEGEVFFMRHGYLSAMVGKKTYAHELAIMDVVRGDPERNISYDLGQEVAQAVLDNFSAVISDEDYWMLQRNLDQSYRKEESIFQDEAVFWPVTGMKTRPEWIFVPRMRVTQMDGLTKVGYKGSEGGCTVEILVPEDWVLSKGVDIVNLKTITGETKMIIGFVDSVNMSIENSIREFVRGFAYYNDSATAGSRVEIMSDLSQLTFSNYPAYHLKHKTISKQTGEETYVDNYWIDLETNFIVLKYMEREEDTQVKEETLQSIKAYK